MFINKSSHKLIARLNINKMRNTLSAIQGSIIYIFLLLFSSHGYIVALFFYLNLEIETKKLEQYMKYSMH